MNKIRVHWFRRDLRLNDHPIWQPHEEAPTVAVVFEPTTPFEPVRKFWRECVDDLKRRTPQLRWFELSGDPVQAWRALTENLSITAISTALSWNSEEEALLESVKASLPHVQWRFFRDQCLHDPAESNPGRIRSFTSFYQDIKNRPLSGASLSRSLPIHLAPNEALGTARFQGGESAGLAQLRFYLQHPEGVQKYHERRNGMLEYLDSSKLSPWLAWGCVSPIRVAHELLELLSKGTAPEGAEKLLYELYWREFFKHTSLTLGQSLFSLEGRRNRAPDITAGEELFERWKLGNTGHKFNDANMRELLLTGWMSNRGRQNVASYWSKTLQGDWRWGARWFSERLIDYDPESNWGNWQYLAGVGYDPRDRVFNLDRQAEMYDPEGAYQRRWLEASADSHPKPEDHS